MAAGIERGKFSDKRHDKKGEWKRGAASRKEKGRLIVWNRVDLGPAGKQKMAQFAKSNGVN